MNTDTTSTKSRHARAEVLVIVNADPRPLEGGLLRLDEARAAGPEAAEVLRVALQHRSVVARERVGAAATWRRPSCSVYCKRRCSATST